MRRRIELPGPPTLTKRKAKPFKPFAKVILAAFGLPLLYLLFNLGYRAGGWMVVAALAVVLAAEIVVLVPLKKAPNPLRFAIAIGVPVVVAGIVALVKLL